VHGQRHIDVLNERVADVVRKLQRPGGGTGSGTSDGQKVNGSGTRLGKDVPIFP
jgi:hypothetical protein